MHPMKASVKVTLGVAGVLVAGMLVAGFAIWGLLARNPCANEVLAEFPAPSHRTRAIVFQRSCGATTAFSTQVSLLPASRPLPNDGGNVFIADTDHGRAPAGPAGGPVVEVRWVKPGELEVRYDARARVFRADSLVTGVRIRFVTIALPGA
jgi:hypothetical protein